METILVVDDDNINLAICKAHLSKEYNVVTTLSGVQALGYIRTAKGLPSLILLDVYMPTESGFDVLKQLREVKEYASIPVIMLTNIDDYETMAEGYRGGAVDFLFKPIVSEVMNQKIKIWLNYRRLEKENTQMKKRLQSIAKLAQEN